MDNYITRANFVNRLSALQRLCSDHDSNFPSALLFVPGQDGRNNKGSITVLKFLLRGSVSKELFDETLEASYEPFEEIIFLVKQSSLTVIWSHEMKELLTPLFEAVPVLIEYISTVEEESEMDLQQARKCCDFKRMMLESVAQGSGVGIPIPIGYDDIQDIESWPMLQAFALDHVYCPTGFFTARYNVADITAHLEILFRTVDGYYVDNAIRAMNRTIGPHMVQSICMLDASSADQRMRVTADDVVGPLEILYDFGEMEAAGTVDASTQAVVLFGPDTAQFGAVQGAYPAAWRDQVAGRSLHAIIEGCDPSTGLRWCRTYFLQRGHSAARMEVSDDILALDDEDGSSGSDSKHSEAFTAAHSEVDHGVTSSLQRLEALYIKLLLSLRLVVKLAFARHSDVLEAGTEVQRKLDLVMKGQMDAEQEGVNIFEQEQWRSLALDAASWSLRPHEQLQVHMDCLNAVGEIVTIEDVDDMGGSCWTYIRVAVHGIAVEPYGAHPATVAVGDTFLFSSHRSTITSNTFPAQLAATGAADNDRLLLQGDGICITHPLPYYRCLIGAGAEEVSTRRLLACTRSTHMLANLGLGKPLDYTGTGLLTLTVLTDHPVVPHFEAELRTFTEGFLIEKMDGASCLPLLTSIGRHVDRVWTVDTTDCVSQAAKLIAPLFLKEKGLPDIDVPAGFIIIFRLKSADQLATDGEASMNPLEASLPLVSSNARHIALIVPSSSRAFSAVTSAAGHWRTAMRMHDVQEHRGGTDVALPDGILRAVLSVLDFWSEGVPNTVAATDTSGDASDKQSLVLSASSYASLYGTALCFAKVPTLQIPGAGYYAMRCVHAVSDAQRVSGFDYGAIEQQATEEKKHSTELVVLVGQAGIGMALIASNLSSQLADLLGVSAVVSTVTVDFAKFALSRADSSTPASHDEVVGFVQECFRHRTSTHIASKRELVVVSAVECAAQHIPAVKLLSLLAHLEGDVAAAVAVLSPSTFAATEFRYASKPVSETACGLGFEFWKAVGMQDAVQGVCADLVLLVDEPTTGGDIHKEFRAHLEVANPSAQILKLAPGNLRLDRDSLEVVLDSVQSSAAAKRAGGSLTERYARALSEGVPLAALIKQLPAEARAEYLQSLRAVHPHCPAHVGIGLIAVHLSPATLGVSEWSLQCLLQSVQLLFPAAKIFSSAVEGTWKVPARKAGRTSKFHRLIQLAKAKVMSARQEEEGQKLYHFAVARLKKTKAAAGNEEVLTRLVRGVRSVHGAVHLASGAGVLEANSSFVVVRPSAAVDASAVGLTVQGVLGKQEIALLEELFTACAQFKLQPRVRRSSEDVSQAERISIQLNKKYSDKFALPGNWWFDGQTYVDINGTRRPLRPDIEKLVDLFLADEHAQVAEYNALLAEM